STIRDRNANACDDFARRDHRVNVWHSSSLNTSSAFGRPVLAIRQTYTYPTNFRRRTLAGRPYDLRHACASTWLNAGVAPTRVAQWLGHSVDVLLRVYAKCIDGHEGADRKRIERFMSPRAED
ncbi:hypothetical protein ABN028_23540, partial [Actinopolymorpha sp. B17G11]